MEITENAVKQFKKVISEAEMPDAGMRIFISGGGCCGPSYGMDVSQNGETGDEVIEKEDLKFYVERRALIRLSNAIVDFNESGANPGFTIKGTGSTCCS